MSNYTPYYEGGWKNEEEMTTTPICAEALNHMEEGISAAYDTVDPTLSVAGMAADAKAVGDALAQIDPGGGGGGGSVTVDTALSSTSTNPVQNKKIYEAIQAVKAVATTSTNGLMSSTDKGRLDTLYADYSSALTALG